MYGSSQMYDPSWESHIGTSNVGKVGGSEHPCFEFEVIKSPFNLVSPLQTSSDAFCGTRSSMSFHHHSVPPSVCSELPKTTDSSPLLFRQSSEDNFTITTTKRHSLPPTSPFSFSNSLHSIESFLSTTDESCSSSEKHSGFPSDSDKYSDFPGGRVPLYEHFSQENNLPAEDEKPIQISFLRNQVLTS